MYPHTSVMSLESVSSDSQLSMAQDYILDAPLRQQPDVQLYVKAGLNGESYGACPSCQRVFLVLYLKANDTQLDFTVTTVNLKCPPKSFSKQSNSVPLLVHRDCSLTGSDEIIDYIDDIWPLPCLRETSSEAVDVTLGLLAKFSFYLKEVSSSPKQLLKQLGQIDRLLQSSGLRFLCADNLTHLDCEFLPKLQHIRVAGKAFRGFDIPADFEGIWHYLSAAYEEPAFRRTCPCDQEIVAHWADRSDVPRLSKTALHFYSIKNKPRYSYDTPTNYKNCVDENMNDQLDATAGLV